jgi:hypothetical protein
MELELRDDTYAPSSREDAIEWFPEVNDIQNDRLRETTIGVIQQFPNYFWMAPAASRHHPPEHRIRHGLVLHTKRVCTAFERTAESMVQQNHLSWDEVDMGRAACICHDGMKYGLPPTSTESTVYNHDTIMGEWLEKNTQMPEEVVGAVEAHSGSWYKGKSPETHLEQMVHIADLHASDKNVRIAVKKPNKVLRKQFPRVSER